MKSKKNALGMALSNLTEKAAEVSNETIKGVRNIYDKAISRSKVDSSISQGNLFEDIEVAKFNEEAVRQGSNLRAVTTESLGMNTDSSDVFIMDGNKVLEKAQLKSGEEAVNITKAFREDKYNDMQKVTNKEHFERVKDLSKQRADRENIYKDNYEDTVENVTGELHYDDISSGGTTYNEAVRAAKHPFLDASSRLVKATGKEYVEFLKVGIPITAALSIVSGLIKNYPKFKNNEIDEKELASEVVDETKGAIGNVALLGFISTTVRNVAQVSGNGVLSSTRPAMTAAIVIKDISAAVIEVSKGEIELAEFVEKVIDSGVVNITATVIAISLPGASIPVSMVTSIGSYYVTEKVYSNIKTKVKKFDKQRRTELELYLSLKRKQFTDYLSTELPKFKLNDSFVKVVENKVKQVFRKEKIKIETK